MLAGETSQGLVQRLDSLLDYLLPLYLAEGKCSLVIGSAAPEAGTGR